MFYVASHQSDSEFNKYPQEVIHDKQHFKIINLSDVENKFADINDKDGPENIHNLNPQLNELCAAYYAWKNDKSSPWKGLCHYHRYLFKDDKMLTGPELDNLMKEYDIICIGTYHYDDSEHTEMKDSMWDGLWGHSDEKTMSLAFGALINMAWKNNNDATADLLYNHLTHHGGFMTNNVFCARADLFDNYCKWIFSFAIPAAKICTDNRIIGFCCERLFSCWADKITRENPSIRVLQIDCKDINEEEDRR